MGPRDIRLSQSSRNCDIYRFPRQIATFFRYPWQIVFFVSFSATNCGFFRFSRHIAILLAWKLTNRYRFWRNGTKLGQMLLYRLIGYVIYVTSRDIWCQAINRSSAKSRRMYFWCALFTDIFSDWSADYFVNNFTCYTMLGIADFHDFLVFIPQYYSNFATRPQYYF